MTDLRSAFAVLPPISEVQARIIERILHASIAWQTIAQLERATRLDQETMLDALADLDASGWVETWDREPEPVVTLSVAGAAALNARIVEYGRSRTPRWSLVGDPEPPEPVASGVSHLVQGAGLSAIADPKPGPEALAMIYEEQVAAKAIPGKSPRLARADRLPFPTIILGSSLTPWPGPGTFLHGVCPACRSQPLRPRTYCLGCDRWGLDHLLTDETERTRPTRGRTHQAETLRGDKQRRIEKRRSRLLGNPARDRDPRSGVHPEAGATR